MCPSQRPPQRLDRPGTRRSPSRPPGSSATSRPFCRRTHGRTGRRSRAADPVRAQAAVDHRVAVVLLEAPGHLPVRLDADLAALPRTSRGRALQREAGIGRQRGVGLPGIVSRSTRHAADRARGSGEGRAGLSATHGRAVSRGTAVRRGTAELDTGPVYAFRDGGPLFEQRPHIIGQRTLAGDVTHFIGSLAATGRRVLSSTRDTSSAPCPRPAGPGARRGVEFEPHPAAGPLLDLLFQRGHARQENRDSTPQIAEAHATCGSEEARHEMKGSQSPRRARPRAPLRSLDAAGGPALMLPIPRSALVVFRWTTCLGSPARRRRGHRRPSS